MIKLGLSMVDKYSHMIDHVSFEKLEAKGAQGWMGTDMFNQSSAAPAQPKTQRTVLQLSISVHQTTATAVVAR